MIDRERIADLIAAAMNRYEPGDNSPRGALLRAADSILNALADESEGLMRSPFYPAASFEATNAWRRSESLRELTWEEYDPDGVMDPERPGMILRPEGFMSPPIAHTSIDTGLKVDQDARNPTQIPEATAQAMVQSYMDSQFQATQQDIKRGSHGNR